jgi:hypothetical protein
MTDIDPRQSPAPLSTGKQSLAAALLLAALAVFPAHAGGMMGEGGGGGWGPPPPGRGGWGPPPYSGRTGYPGVGRWQDCHRFNAASRAAFRHGDYARGNALQDRFYDCMKSRWIR